MLVSNNIGTKIQGASNKNFFVMFDLKDTAAFMYTRLLYVYLFYL